MKLRIKGNSLRLRLTSGEVEELVQKGVVKASIAFPGAHLRYQIISNDHNKLSFELENGLISVAIPNTIVKKWAQSDQVTISDVLPNLDGTDTSILIEKDFQCLKPRPGEDESDLFPNPLADPN